MEQSGIRYVKLDEIRGLTLLSMILYHFMWDLTHIAGVDCPWYKSAPGHIWQQSICWTFIFLSGFCWSLGRRRLKRGLTVFLAGGIVTAATLLFLPESRVIFGVLTLLGSCTLLLIPASGLLSRVTGRAALTACLAACFVLFLLFKNVNYGYILPLLLGGPRIFLPEQLYSGWLSAYLGFPAGSFYSSDYFSLIPWAFLFLGGYFCYRIAFSPESADTPARRRFDDILRTETIPCASWLGRHSLLIYMLHQPVLFAVTQVIMLLWK